MQELEPFFYWRHKYIASEDPRSPLFEHFNSEVFYTHTIYNHVIHPQWDYFGSSTLFLKILYCNYENEYVIIEFLGEWNDCISNDIMFLKRDIVDPMIAEGIKKFILIGENILIFHPESDDYYQEWFDDIEDGWIAAINFRPHVKDDFNQANIDYYICFSEETSDMPWRTYSPEQLYNNIDKMMQKRLM